MKKCSRVLLVLATLFALAVPLTYARTEELPPNREEAVLQKVRELRETAGKPGVYPVVIRYQVGGETVEQTIRLTIVDDTLQRDYTQNRNQMGLFTNINSGIGDWSAQNNLVLYLFQGTYMVILIVFAVLLFGQFYMTHKLIQETQALFSGTFEGKKENDLK